MEELDKRCGVEKVMFDRRGYTRTWAEEVEERSGRHKSRKLVVGSR